MKSHKSDSFELYCADSYEFLHENEDRLNFQSCVTDPPYDFRSQGGRTFKRSTSYLDTIRGQEIDNGFDYIVFDVLKRADSLMVFCHNDQLENILPLRECLEYERMALLEWHKDNPMPVANKHYVPDTEFIVHFWRAGGHPKGQLCEKNRYIITPVGKNDFVFKDEEGKDEKHPTVKPQSVMQWLIANSCEAGETIIDPFAGTGSTGVAAIRHGRKFIGIEKEEKYYEVALERLLRAEDQKSLF